MSVVSAIAGIAVVAICFCLMAWGRKYLGEEAGRSPAGEKGGNAGGTADNPCRSCGSCHPEPEK